MDEEQEYSLMDSVEPVYNEINEFADEALDFISDINDKASDVLRSRAPYDEAPGAFPNDDSWVRLSFVTPTDKRGNGTVEGIDLSNRSFSSASLKYTDSSIGGNLCINPPPQFTRYADVREVGIRDNPQKTSLGLATGDIGMGRYYSEAIDDNNQIIHLRFGVPQYNSLTQFFTGFYSSKQASAARAGTFDSGFVDSLLRGAGQVIGLAIAPLFIIPLAVIMLGTAARFVMNWPSSKFYTLKPAMPMYWTAVQSMVNQIGINQGLIYPEDSDTSRKVLEGEVLGRGPQELKNIFHQIIPEEMNENGTINVEAIANKSKRRQMQFENNLKDLIENNPETFSDPVAFGDSIREAIASKTLLKKNLVPYDTGRFALESYLTRTAKFLGDLFKSKEGTVERDPRVSTADTKSEYVAKKPEDGFFDYFLANLADGSEWASFRVDYTGVVSESFSNSVTESSLASKMNSVSKTAREARHTFADGNVDSLGIVKSVTDMVTSVANGIGSVLHIEGLAAIAGNAFIDIPKAWDSSTASLPKSTYTITLSSPYGNPISQMFNIYIPLSMLLCGALPLSTGKQSYTSPFLCEIHDRGRLLTRMGIIDSLSITRGTSNLGFNNDGKALAIEVTFSVLDLSSIVSVPIRPSFSLMPLDGLFDSENAFSDYLMAISGMKLGDTVYTLPMLKRQYKRLKADFSTFATPAHFGAWAAQLPGISALSGLMRGTDKK